MTIKEILTRWNDFECSEERRNMLVGSRYFNGINDICLPENGRYDTSLDEQNNPYYSPTRMSDRRIAHNFYKFIITQQMAYGIARNFILTTSAIEVIEDKKNIWNKIKSLLFAKERTKRESDRDRFEELNILVSKHFKGERYATFLEACENAPKKGIGWLYLYYGEDGTLNFMNMNPEEICPIWKDEKKNEVVEVIRKYKRIEYSEEGKKEVEYIEHYTLDYIEVYKSVSEEGIEPELIETKNYITYVDGSIGRFDKLPFISIKYNGERRPLLCDIKEMLDAYDKLQSETVNNVVDIPDSLIAVQGYDGTNDKEKAEFEHNLKIFRIMYLPDNATATPLIIPQDINQNELTLTRLRKDIFEIGGGVDTQNKDLKDTSGVALRWSYSNLEEKFNRWGNQLEIAIKRIIEFINYDNVLNGGEDYSDVDYEIIYDTDSIINETETINNLVLSKGLISAETIAAEHPYTKDAKKEYEGMHREKEFESKLKSTSIEDKKEQANNDHNIIEERTKASI